MREILLFNIDGTHVVTIPVTSFVASGERVVAEISLEVEDIIVKTTNN